MTSLAKALSQLADPAVLRVLFKTVLVTAAIFLALAWAMWWSVDWALGYWTEAYLPADYSETVAGIIAIPLAVLSAWLLFRVIALAVLQFFADEIVAAVEARHYPIAARTAKALPLRRELANSVRGLTRALFFNALALPVAVLLAVTGIGSALVFLLVNAVLLGRELTDMAWLRHCEGDVGGNPVPGGERFMLGGAIAAIMLVPLANLLAPVLGAAAGTHLTQRAIARRLGEHETPVTRS
ncbi:MAG: EI24 domain-containing protein [Pseudomonadota bacterium]